MQAGIRQIDKIAPTAPLSFQTDSMIPIGSLQPTNRNFPAPNATITDNNAMNAVELSNNHHQQQHHQGMHQQPTYPGLPHAPTAQQMKDLGPIPTTEESLNPILLNSQPHVMQQQQQQQPPRNDPFGQTPFLPPPPSKSNRGASGAAGQGRYGFIEQPNANAANKDFGNDKYAAFGLLDQASTAAHNFGQINQTSKGLLHQMHFFQLIMRHCWTN